VKNLFILQKKTILLVLNLQLDLLLLPMVYHIQHCVCNRQDRAWVILVTVVRYRNRDKTIQNSYRGNRDRTGIKAGSKLCSLCYTRERVKREEQETLQHQTTSLYIHFVCHPRIIPHLRVHRCPRLSVTLNPSIHSRPFLSTH